MSKIKLKDQLGRVVRIDGDGATVGRNLRWPDGSVVQESQIRGGGTVTTRVVSSGATRGSGASPSTTLWKLILEIPANIQKLAALAGVGFITRSSDGEMHQRQVKATAGELTVTNGDGASDDPQLGLADVTPTSGGSVKRVAFDAKGRRSAEASATTDDLSEGTANLYYTDERVDTRVQAGNYTITGNWVFNNDINLSGGWRIGRGPGGHATNLVIGSGALGSRTTATYCLAIGANALADNLIQSSVMAIGGNAFQRLTGGGAGSVAIGNEAGRDATNTQLSTLVGGDVAKIAPTLISCTIVGGTAGSKAPGNGTTAFGRAALFNLDNTVDMAASFNCAFGREAGRDQVTGGWNSYFGDQAGVTQTPANANVSGVGNTFVGYQSGPATPTQLVAASAFGYRAVVSTNNTVVLGRTTDNTVIGATGNDGSGAKLQVTGAIKSTTEYRVGANKVVGARETGWSALTGTVKKGGGATYTAPTISNPPTQAEVQAMADALQDAHRTIKALTDALITHGLIGA